MDFTEKSVALNIYSFPSNGIYVFPLSNQSYYFSLHLFFIFLYKYIIKKYDSHLPSVVVCWTGGFGVKCGWGWKPDNCQINQGGACI